MKVTSGSPMDWIQSVHCIWLTSVFSFKIVKCKNPEISHLKKYKIWAFLKKKNWKVFEHSVLLSVCGNNQIELSIAGSYTGSRCSVVCHSSHPPSCVISKPLSLCDLPVLIWICQPLYWTFGSLVHISPWGRNVKSPFEWGDLQGGSKLRFKNILLLPILWNS